MKEKPRSGVLLLVFAVVLAILLLAGATYEQWARARERERFPQIGRSIDVGGRSLNLFCSGTGTPAVIFESGAPRPGYSWVLIQREAARFTRACWYDRAGFGWSDLGPYPRTSDASARDLHALLRAAGIAPPYVLVPETLAAFDARVYTHLYPADVTGMVMVDGTPADFVARMPEARGRAAAIQKYIGYPQTIVSQVFNEIGLLRAITPQAEPAVRPVGLTAHEWETIWHVTRQPKARAALIEEMPAAEISAAEVGASGDLGARPLVVLSSTNLELQAGLAGLSTRGKQVVLRAGDGVLQYREPSAVVAAILGVVRQLR